MNRLEEELNELTKNELRGAAVRAKIQYYEEGEKSTKFFLGLEKSRQKKKVMRKLVTDQGHLVLNQEDILNEQVHFYKKLYKEGPTNDQAQNSFLNNICNFLSPTDTELCDQELTTNELKTALYAMKYNKSPGLDGLTAEYFKYFWWHFNDIFHFLLERIFKNNELCQSMKIGVISLIPKKGDLTRLNNWRPISLLNTDYKIINKALANIISRVITNLISEDQTCCIPGRDISENVIAMNLIIDHVKDNNSNGFILKIDQYKAFDCVNHDYLFNVIKAMGFGPNFQK